MKNELIKNYNPSDVESDIYEFWLENDFFKAKIDKSKKPFTIVMPPPNITGKLHMGHALDETLQDTIIRFKRMQGFSALWIPGTDHASIATEAKIVQKMREEGISKEEIGRAVKYRYVVVNDTVEKAEETIANIIAAEHNRTDLNEDLLKALK